MIEEYIRFARDHAQRKYGADISGVNWKILSDGERVDTLRGKQNGLFLDSKIGSRSVKAQYGIVDDLFMLLGNLGVEKDDDQYFGVIFHELGHATFNALGKNSEDGAFCMELTATVDAVVAGLVPLGVAQAYTKKRVEKGMLSIDLRLVKNALWQAEAKICREYLLNETRTLMSCPGGLVA